LPPTVDFTTAPGLDSVNYGQNAAYVARITNHANSTLRNTTFSTPVPSTDGGPATFLAASCAGTLTATQFSCVVDRVHAGQTFSITIVWKTPATGTSSGCPSADPCLTSSGTFTAGSLTLPAGPAATSLLPAGDSSSAATYALAPCTIASGPTLQTDPNLSPSNPLSTTVCAPHLPPAQLGLVTSIDELPKPPSLPGVAPEASDICIPAPLFGCNATPFVFAPKKATFTFVILNSSLPPSEVIDQVFHNGVLVSTSPSADPYVESIKVQPFKGITTVTVKSSTNGSWTFG
jgi:hypothetical protein